MPLELFVKFDGVTGDSRGQNLKGWSDVVSWQWHAARNDTAAAGAPALHLDAISLRKKIGSDSPGLLSALADGRVIPRAELRAVPVLSKREAAQKYLAIVLDGVRIVSITMTGATQEEYFAEDIVLRFAAIAFEHSSYAPTGPDRPAEAAVDTVFQWAAPDGVPH